MAAVFLLFTSLLYKTGYYSKYILLNILIIYNWPK